MKKKSNKTNRMPLRSICFIFILALCVCCNSVILAQQPTLYGLTSNGGTNGTGVLFGIPTGSTSTSQLYSFAASSGTAANGSVPYGSLLQASNGKLYGMASQGGGAGSGVIFEYDPSLSTYSLMFAFGGTSGAGPSGELIQASNGKFYGMTTGGGASIYGVLFEYDPSTYTYTKKVDFIGLNGASPYGSLIQASNGKLYGMTNNGGANYFGNIFEYDLSNSTYTNIYNFNSTNGKYPYGSLIQASNGKLYGMTSDGGANNSGVIFEYNLSTSTCTTLVDFNGSGYGATPKGSLLQAANGKLYGLTMYGGTSNAGALFEYDLTNSTFTKKLDFIGANGQNPQGSLMQASNGKLYGMTYQAGSSTFGTLFEYDYLTNTFVTKLNFNGTNGGFPTYGHLIELNPCAVTGTVTKTNITCNGAADGSATVTASGTGPYTYSWSVSGGTASTVSNLSPGIYTVVITGAYSCTATKTVNITQPANLTATTAQTNVTCFGGTNGIASVTPSGGTSPYTYSWTSSSSTLSSASGLSAGNYTATIKDNKNCVTTKTFAITQGTAVTISVNSGTICSGKTFTITPSGANTYTYQGGSASVSPTTSTNYTVQGSDALGCLSPIVTSSVTVNASPNVTITPSNTISCSADNLTLTAGGAATYLWSNGTTTTAAWVISPNANTTRTVVGTAANGCTNQAVQSISVIPSPTVTLVPSSTVVCSADAVTLTAGGASTYTWSNALGNASVVTVSSASNYTRTVTGTAANGCTASASQAIVVNTSPTVLIVPSSTVVCSANTVTLTTSGASTYTWSNSLGNATLVTVSSASNYTRSVTGSAANGCTASASQSILVNTTPTVNIVPSNTAVCSANSVTFTTSGASTYTWSNSLGNATLVTFSSASNYTLSVTGSANSCTASASQAVVVNTSPTVVIVPSSTVVCSANTVTLTTSGASTYTWSNSLGNATLVTISSPSNYTRTVTGSAANGCTASASQSILVNTTPTLSIVPSSTAVCSANSLTLTVSGASTYTWSNSLGNATLVTFSSASNYTLSVTGTSNNCSASTSQAILVNTTPTINIVPSSTVVCSANTVTLTANGASTYTWSNALGNASLVTVSSASNYTRTVIGTANGCTNQAVQSISVNTTPTITIAPTGTLLCSGNSSTLTANGAGTYTWLASGPTSSINAVTPLTNTAYTVVGTSSLSNCTNTAVVTISVNPTPTITINPSNTLVCSGSSVSLVATGATTYTWTNGPSTASYTLTPASSSGYSVSGETAGCFGTAVTSVSVKPSPTVTVNSGTICTGNSFTMTPAGANTYSWNTGATTSTLIVTPPASTIFIVTGTATNNCSGTATANVIVGNNLVVTIVPSTNSVCAGNSVTLTASGANSYTWSNTFTSTSIVVNPSLATTYSVLGSSGPSCTNTASQFISILPSPTLNVTGNNFICLGLSTILNANGATTYTWSTGPTTASVLVTPTATTIYTVSGANSFNCINSATYQVETTPLVTPSLCLVTVDSLSINNEIYWDKSLYPQADSFIVYRESSASFYSVIARLSKNDLGFYTDTNRSIGPNNGNPNFSSYKYKMQIRDTCGNLSALSDYHKTIFIQDFQTGSFSWNYYNINGVDQQSINYVLYRRNVLSGITTSIGGTSGTAFTDPQYNTFAAAGNVKWFVGMSGFACDPNAKLFSTTATTVSTTKSNASNERQFPVLTEGLEKNYLALRTIRIFPNPANDNLTLDFGKGALTIRIAMCDIAGRLVFTDELRGETSQVSLQNIKNGIYFITLYDGNKPVKTEKIIVHHP